MTKDNPGVWANGRRGGGGGGGVGLGMHYPCLASPDFPTEKGMVFRVNFTIWRLWQVVFLEQKSMMAADERSTFGNNVFPKFFELKHLRNLRRKSLI